MNEVAQIQADGAVPVSGAASVLTCHDHNNDIRWSPGERLHTLFERQASRADADLIALEVDGEAVTFTGLDRRANQMARHLRARGLQAGDRVGLIIDRSIDAYVALLAVLKIEAVYVPLDVKFPADRIAFIAEDAELKAFVVTVEARRLVDDLDLIVWDLDELAVAAEAHSDLPSDCVTQRSDQLCYIIYTSGSTGRPKGVAVNHSSICNFVRVAAEVYGYERGDRVYQGMTLAFDFSVEELWVPLLSGATLVPAPADRQLVGQDLAEFLASRRISAMCCVPTLLATLEDDLPDLRLLLVSGEACPPDIVARWQRPGRRMLNAYGPTEATVTATWTEVSSDEAVTIGVPLPTYTVAILETARDALVESGGIGEIAIGGVGLAVGYVNRDDLTRKAFVPDILGLPNNPSHRLYRTGDLGRINNGGEIEYLGRIDTQVKIRGYRIELAEIENVLLEIDGIAQAVATTYEAEPGLVELAAYFTYFDSGQRPSREKLLKVLRSRLPGYMVPAYIEELDRIPLLASHKADRKALPPPLGMRLVSGSIDYAAPRDEMERLIAECLAKTLKLDAVSIDDHFFDDLGAHSLLMGQFVAALNGRMTTTKAAISDVYLAPSVALLAAELKQRGGGARDSAPNIKTRSRNEPHFASDLDYIRCGVLQGLFIALQYAFYLVLFAAGIGWVADVDEASALLWRAVLFSVGSLALTMALPITAKWLLIGRWSATEIPLWSLSYVRFWIVQQLTALSPWRAFQATVLFNVYLRLLGAKIGHGAVILTDTVPLVTDLLCIGDRAVVRKNVHIGGYKAELGVVRTGAVTLGDDVLIGEHTLIDIDTSIGDRGQLGHASALLEGQHLAADARYHGSPAEPTDTEFRRFHDLPASLARRAGYAAARLCLVVLGIIAATVVSAGGVNWMTGSSEEVAVAVAISGTGLLQVILASFAVFVGGYLIAFAVHMVAPRLLRFFIRPNKVYPLYGFHHYIAGLISGLGYSPVFQLLFGDSSAIVHYLGWAGVRQPDVVQTGSNFGTAMSYESAFDLEFGRGSMVSDGFSVVNFEMGSGAFRLISARIGTDSFVGNSLVYPAGARTGNNCLLGSKVMVPIDGPIRENVGLLGSPPFEIPRDVVNARRFHPVPTTEAERARLKAKNWFNLRTALLHLASQWSLLAGLMVVAYLVTGFVGEAGYASLALCAVLAPLIILLHGVVAERMSLAGIRIEPHSCTIHEPYFWWIERHWKLGETLLEHALTGTVFRGPLLRLLGLKVGSRYFDDGSSVPEKALVEIGDNCCINAGSSIQGHSLEDGLYKSDRIVIGDNCTVGPSGLVHYGVTMGPQTILAPDAFLMKGAKTNAGSMWVGNPAFVV